MIHGRKIGDGGHFESLEHHLLEIGHGAFRSVNFQKAHVYRALLYMCRWMFQIWPNIPVWIPEIFSGEWNIIFRMTVPEVTVCRRHLPNEFKESNIFLYQGKYKTYNNNNGGKGHQTKGLMSSRMALHARYKSWSCFHSKRVYQDGGWEVVLRPPYKSSGFIAGWTSVLPWPQRLRLSSHNTMKK